MTILQTTTSKLLGTDDPAVVKTWIIVSEAAALSAVAVLPYALSIANLSVDEMNAQLRAAGKRQIDPRNMVLLSGLQSHVVFGLLTGLGLRAARSLDLGLPHLEKALRGRHSGLKLSDVAVYAGLGAGFGGGLIVLDKTVFSKVRAALEKAGLREPAPWKGFLASFYGSIAEEVMSRLAVQSFVAVGLRRLQGKRRGPVSAGIMWSAIGLSSLFFGAGHLPAAARITPLNLPLVVRTLVLNGLIGTVFGYLYWKRGLEAAMIAHGSADLVLHVAGAMFQGEPAAQEATTI
jgi:membrane protease YdiL (CAAX protease family)